MIVINVPLAGWLAARCCASHIPRRPLSSPSSLHLSPSLFSFPPPTCAAPWSQSVLLQLTEITPSVGYLSNARLASASTDMHLQAAWRYSELSEQCHCECLLHNVFGLIVRATYQSQWSRSYFWLL